MWDMYKEMEALDAKQIVDKIKELSNKEAKRANDTDLVGPLKTILKTVQLNRETFVKYFLNKLQTFIDKTPAVGKPIFTYQSIDAFTLSKEFESFIETHISSKYENSIAPTKNTTINNIKYCLDACKLALSDSIGFKTGDPTFDITVVIDKQSYIDKMNATVKNVNQRFTIELPTYILKGADVVDYHAAAGGPSAAAPAPATPPLVIGSDAPATPPAGSDTGGGAATAGGSDIEGGSSSRKTRNRRRRRRRYTRRW